jgi:hypothetical protein
VIRRWRKGNWIEGVAWSWVDAEGEEKRVVGSGLGRWLAESKAVQSEGERHKESPDALLHLLHLQGEQYSDWLGLFVIFHSNSRVTHPKLS